jgi:hypothetical protein
VSGFKADLKCANVADVVVDGALAGIGRADAPTGLGPAAVGPPLGGVGRNVPMPGAAPMPVLLLVAGGATEELAAPPMGVNSRRDGSPVFANVTPRIAHVCDGTVMVEKCIPYEREGEMQKSRRSVNCSVHLHEFFFHKTVLSMCVHRKHCNRRVRLCTSVARKGGYGRREVRMKDATTAC